MGAADNSVITDLQESVENYILIQDHSSST